MTGFLAPTKVNQALAGQPVAQLLGSAADIVVIIDSKGVVIDLSSSVAAVSSDSAVGRRLSDLVTLESKAKVGDMLGPAPIGPMPRKFEINHRASNGGEVAFSIQLIGARKAAPRSPQAAISAVLPNCSSV